MEATAEMVETEAIPLVTEMPEMVVTVVMAVMAVMPKEASRS